MSNCIKVIRTCMSEGLNLLLVGYHGVGKTQMVLEEVKHYDLKMKYYSSPTLDPWSDLVGIPVPVDAKGSGRSKDKQLQFIRPADVEDAEIMFFDELNRAHPKVLNAVLEAIQFHSINGKPLQRLKMVWAAINPPDDIYEVNELDPVVSDRFHVHLRVPAEPSVSYYTEKAGIALHIAKALVMWWHRDLDDNLRQIVSPRRLEYMGQNYSKGLELRYLVPPSVKAPLQYLIRRIEGKVLLPFELTRQILINKQAEIVIEIEGNLDVMLAVNERLLAWPDIVPQCVDLFLAMTSELQAKLLAKSDIKRALVNLGRQGRNGTQNLRPLADRLVAMGILR
jgi:hypothetical protein